MSKEVFESIKAGLEDALAYAKGDKTRGTVRRCPEVTTCEHESPILLDKERPTKHESPILLDKERPTKKPKKRNRRKRGGKKT